MISHRACVRAIWLGICGILFLWFAAPAGASTISSYLDASLTSGPLAATNFVISFSYNDSSLTGIGEEYLGLQSFDFTLLGTQFTLADIDQGGQALFKKGSLYLVVGAFFPEAPLNSAVTDIALGFGGPGVSWLLRLGPTVRRRNLHARIDSRDFDQGFDPPSLARCSL